MDRAGPHFVPESWGQKSTWILVPFSRAGACSRGHFSGYSILQALLLGIGLQHKSVDQLEKEIELPAGQLMGLFNRIIRKVMKVIPAEGTVSVSFK